VTVSWGIEQHETLESTQDMLKLRAVSGAPEGLVIQAQQQTAGRGRHGREWVSPQAGNLYMSFLLRPDCAVAHIGQLAFVTALALARAVSRRLENPDQLRLKWPNDALLEGRKCAGILIDVEQTPQQKIDWVVVGMGVNVAYAPVQIGACLKDFSAGDFTLDELRDDILQEFAAVYTLWNASGFAPVRSEWLALAHKRGDPLRVRIAEQEYQGSFYDVDERGALILQDNERRLRTITAGDVFL
jgi:BirA family biotin operon repressor/biotin-[acetyl-CoA-carboxylase] ligase